MRYFKLVIVSYAVMGVIIAESIVMLHIWVFTLKESPFLSSVSFRYVIKTNFASPHPFSTRRQIDYLMIFNSITHFVTKTLPGEVRELHILFEHDLKCHVELLYL